MAWRRKARKFTGEERRKTGGKRRRGRQRGKVIREGGGNKTNSHTGKEEMGETRAGVGGLTGRQGRGGGNETMGPGEEERGTEDQGEGNGVR